MQRWEKQLIKTRRGQIPLSVPCTLKQLEKRKKSGLEVFSLPFHLNLFFSSASFLFLNSCGLFIPHVHSSHRHTCPVFFVFVLVFFPESLRLVQTVKVAARSAWACGEREEDGFETTTTAATKKARKKTHHQKSRLALLTGNKQSAGGDVCEAQVDTKSTAKERRNNPELEGGRLCGRRCCFWSSRSRDPQVGRAQPAQARRDT